MFVSLESCKTAKCGAGKKCIQRNEQPKCVCAPNCKASKGHRNNHNSKRTMRYIQNENKIEKVRVTEGVDSANKRQRSSQGVHAKHSKKDVDFVDASTNASSKFGKSERVILSDSKVLNRIHGDNKKRTHLSKSIKNENVKGNHSSMMSQSHRHGIVNGFNPQTNWPTMIRTGSYGYDAPLPSNSFTVRFFKYYSLKPHNYYQAFGRTLNIVFTSNLFAARTAELTKQNAN